MTDDDPQPKRRRGLSTGRMEAFSDGVFAIAVTLLILDIAVPVGSGGHLLRAFGDQWPSYLAYFVSFSTVGAAWLAHSAITEYLDRADAVFLRLNLVLLLVVSFLPFPTRMLAEYIGQDRAERVAATVYGINVMLASVLVSVLWRYAVRAHLVRPDADAEEIQVLTRRLDPGLIGYAVLIGVGLFFPIVAVAGYLVIAFYFIVPFGRFGHRRK
jgi:uncharacterized membrane protein